MAFLYYGLTEKVIAAFLNSMRSHDIHNAALALKREKIQIPIH